MAMPDLNPAGEWLYDRLSPWAVDESDTTGWPLAIFCQAWGLQVDEIFTASETGLDGLDDPATAPAWYLPHLAMKAGVQIAGDWDEADIRDAISTRPAERRGTPAAIIAAAESTLTGTKHVALVEKDGGAYKLTVITRTAETPDPAATNALLQSEQVKPVGITLTHVVVDGWTIGEMEAAYSALTLADLEAAFTNIRDLEDNAP